MRRGSEQHPERNSRIVRARLENTSLAAIAHDEGMTITAVNHVLRKAGVVDAQACPAVRERVVSLAADYGAPAAAEMTGLHPVTVRRWRAQAQGAARGC